MNTMDVNGRVFQVRKLLGKGKGGYSYLVTDGEREYVLKQIHHEPCSYYTFGDKLAAELHDYDRLCQAQVPMPRMLDVDRDQERILKEYIPGPTVYDLVKQDALDPIYVTQARDLSLSLERKGLNIDYFPTNFAVNDGALFYIDYECNPFDPKWSFGNWGAAYWSRTDAFLAYGKEKMV